MTLLRDLINIPERVFKGDFVLKLVEGVSEPERTLGDYVVTPELVNAFDQALSLVKSALEGKQSKAAFLHGSFGSGKSHFMAVLHLLLSQDRHARATPEFAPLIGKHRWLEGKKFLLVPFHMIGARSLEAALFGRYVEHIGKLHPKAPVPAVFLGEDVITQAETFRTTLGEAEFFRKLGAGGGEWGNLHEWTKERYEAARTAPPNDERRQSLISAVVTQLLPAYAKVMGADGEGYASLDDGLVALTQHAKDLGYDALIFFLDEVILWLASMVADLRFVSEQGAKLVKLLESQGTARAVPLVSFLARQRDLRELVGDHVPGSEKLGVFDVLKHSSGRFDVIKLEDRNLPRVVEGRLLRPRNDLAAKQIDAAFAETKKVRKDIYETLLTHGFREEDFRRIYPFSPALVQTLVAVSSVLQRERTAIRVLMQLLVDQRETLEIGQLVPVGDLFDVIAEGDEPFSEGMRMHFENAKKLYALKLRPRILQQHGLNEQQLATLEAGDLRRKAFRADDRLVKTLVLAALAPEVESLKAMTAGKLVALNHGTIKAPIAGQESGLVLQRLRSWAADIGEIRMLGDQANPTIHLEIGTVDTESILAKVSRQDNPGTRKAKVRELLYEQFGITAEDKFRESFNFAWRGTKRSMEVVYGNVRELPPDSLRAHDDQWLLVIDYPFDDGYSPDDDLRRIEEFRKKETSRTVCWVPAFLSREALGDLGKLVALDYLLQNEQRFQDNASHLALVEKSQARTLLDGQRSALRMKILRVLEAAYGIANPEPWMLGATIDASDRFQCLLAGQPLMQRPAVATLKQGIEALGEQMLAQQFPKHPNFGIEVKMPVLKRVFEWVQKAARDPQHRTIVEKQHRREVREIVEPLDLGEMGEDALRLLDYWPSSLDRRVAQAKGESTTVGRLRSWIEEEPRGLPKEVLNLVILTYAELTNRRFLKHGGAFATSMDRPLEDELELKEQQLPAEKDWQAARGVAQRLFGIEVASQCGAANVGDLIERVKKDLQQYASSCRHLEQELRTRLQALGQKHGDASRWKTAQATAALCADLQRVGDEGIVECLAQAKPMPSWETMGTSLKQAEAVRQVLANTQWDTFETAWSAPEPHREEAAKCRQQVLQALAQDEHVESLGGALRTQMTTANALLRRLVEKQVTPPVVPPIVPPNVPPVAPPPPTPPGKREVEVGRDTAATAQQLEDIVKRLRTKMPSARHSIEISWRIFEEGGSR